MYVFFIKLFFIYMFLGIEIDVFIDLYVYVCIYINIRNGCFKKFIKLSVKIILVR